MVKKTKLNIKKIKAPDSFDSLKEKIYDRKRTQTDKSRNYLSNEMLREMLIHYKDTAEVTDDLHFAIILLCERISNHHHYRGYPDDFKYELRMEAYLKVINSLSKIDKDKNIFSYMTTIINNKYLECLKLYYKENEIIEGIYNAYEEHKNRDVVVGKLIGSGGVDMSYTSANI